jgi:Bacterial membrane protein YfhO
MLKPHPDNFSSFNWRASPLFGFLPGLFIILVLVGVFHKTIFFDQPISRNCLAANRDVLFRDFYSVPTEKEFDESASQHLVPYHFLVSSYLKKGQLPLWNPYGGCGTPLLADLESMAFSPWMLLFSLFPSMVWFNKLLVLQIIFAALTTYWLARAFGASTTGSLIASFSYALCPFNLFQTELITGQSACQIPILFLTFVMAWKKTSIFRILIAGLACASFISASHPEIAFVAISQACVLMISLFMTSTNSTLVMRITRTFSTLSLIGFFAICFSAPLLLPFIELVFNSDGYKFESNFTADTAYRFKWFITNFCQHLDRSKAPFLGFLTPVLILMSCSQVMQRKYLFAMLLTILSASLCGFRPWPLSVLINSTPLNFSGFYYLPVSLLMLSCFCAIGLDILQTKIRQRQMIASKSFFVIVFIALALPSSIHLGDLIFKSSVLTPFAVRPLLENVILFGLFGLSLFAARQRPRLASLLPHVLIVLSLFSLLFASKFSLPIQGKFDYSNNDVLAMLKKSGERTIGIGWDVFRPNNNMVYEIPSSLIHTVLFPSRYRDFMAFAQCGLFPFETIMLRTKVSHLFNLTATKYFLSLSPISGENDIDPTEERSDLNVSFKNLDGPISALKANYMLCKYDRRKSQISGTIFWSAPEAELDRYLVSFNVLDRHGNTLWFGGFNALRPSKRAENGSAGYDLPFAALYPMHAANNGSLFLGFSVFDKKVGKVLDPENLKAFSGIDAKHLVIIHVQNKDAVVFNEPEHMRLIDEFGVNHIRLYENVQALPRAYLAHATHLVQRKEDVFKTIVENPGVVAGTEVVIEPTELSIDFSCSDKLKEHEYVSFVKSDPNYIEIDVFARSSAVLVLCDTFYPGWIAEVDGKTTVIHRANYLFRGIALNPGRHRVTFRYEPFSFRLGIILAELGLLIGGAAILFRRKKLSQQKLE